MPTQCARRLPHTCSITHEAIDSLLYITATKKIINTVNTRSKHNHAALPLDQLDESPDNKPTTASSESQSPDEQEHTGNARPSVAIAAFNQSATNLLETSSGRDFDIARATKA